MILLGVITAGLSLYSNAIVQCSSAVNFNLVLQVVQRSAKLHLAKVSGVQLRLLSLSFFKQQEEPQRPLFLDSGSLQTKSFYYTLPATCKEKIKLLPLAGWMLL